MDATKLINRENMDNPMRFSIRDRSINLEEMDIEVQELVVKPSEGDVNVHWNETEDFWMQYKQKINAIKDDIREEIEALDEGENFVDGGEWCEENEVPEQAFIQAVKQIEGAQWGSSPLYPFAIRR